MTMNSNKQQQQQNKYFRNTYNYRPRAGYNRRYNNYYTNNRRYNNFGRSSDRNYQRIKSPSPKLGSEEHTQLKIQQTSKQIMEHLFNPTKNPIKTIIDAVDDKPASKSEQKPKPQENKPKKSSNKPTKIDIKEIHRKIISHITNLNDGRKKNLINSTISGYDLAIQQIQKQKRLEISRALRNFCNKENEKESSEYINSIIPDIGISIEDVPKDLIEELSKQLDLEFENEEKQDGISSEMQEDLFNVRNELDELLNSSGESTEENHVINLVNELDDIVERSNSERQIELVANDDELRTSDCALPQLSPICLPTDVFKTTISSLLDKCKDKKEYNLNECLRIMQDVDDAVELLTEYRQYVFSHLKSETVAEVPKVAKRGRKRKKLKSPTKLITNERKRAKENENTDNELQDSVNPTVEEDLNSSISISEDLNDSSAIINDDKSEDEETLAQKIKNTDRYVIPIQEKIVVVKSIENQFVAASESGHVYIYDNSTCKQMDDIKVSETAITALENYSTYSDTLLFVSSLEAPLKTINFKTKMLTNVAFTEINDKVQCMDVAWGYVFLGCLNGNLLRYNIIRERFEFTASITNDIIYALKATSEGARKVLLVSSRNSPISVRDAMSGLYMRSMEMKNPFNIYSLVIQSGVVYCGTVGNDVMMHSFYDGNYVGKLKGGTGDTINCLKMVKNVLFVSSKSNGNIYIFDVRTKYLLHVIRRLNTLILSMDICRNRIIVGTLSDQIISIAIPDNVMQYL